MVLGDLDRYMQKKEKETQPPTYIIQQNKLKMDKDLNVSRDTINVLEENIGSKMSDILYGNIFTDMPPRTTDIKEKINKWDFFKIKSFCMANKNISKMKREPTV